MLSRIAESLYWLGRHVERADCTARLVDAYLPLLPAAGWRIDHRVADPLVSALGLTGAGLEDPSLLLHPLVFDRSEQLVGFRCADRGAGERPRCPGCPAILDLGGAEHHLAHRAIRSEHHVGSAPVPALGPRTLRDRGRTGRRGDEPGRGLELPGRRPVAGTRRHGDPVDRDHRSRRVLRRTPGAPCCSPSAGWEPYMRASGGLVGPASAVQFVLLDRLFPRSVLRCLTTAESVLGELESIGRSTGPDPRRDPSSARRVIGRAQDRPGLLARQRLPRRSGGTARRPAPVGRRARTGASPGRSSSRSRRCGGQASAGGGAA